MLPGLFTPRPDVDEHKIAFADGRGALGGRLIVRVGAVGVDANVGSVLPDQPFAAHGLAEPLHVIEFVIRAGAASAGAQTAANLLPAFGENGVDGPLRDAVAGDLLVAEHRFKLAHQVGGADNLLAQPAQKLHRARIHHRDVHDGVVGRVLHGQRRAPVSIASSRAASSCQLEYSAFTPGSASSRPCSMRCTSLRGSPSAGTK